MIEKINVKSPCLCGLHIKINNGISMIKKHSIVCEESSANRQRNEQMVNVRNDNSKGFNAQLLPDVCQRNDDET